MLTSTDIHYLIGLLTKASNGYDAEVELGAMVYDKSAEKDRGVDVTVIQKRADRTVSVYKGIEVKKHAKPLDVGHIEQLCVKFGDMPYLTHGAIVSASGYTDGAVKKAVAYNVDLYEIQLCTNPIVGIGNVLFYQDGGFPMKEQGLDWLGTTKVAFDLKYPSNEITGSDLNANIQVYEKSGEVLNPAGDIQTFGRILANEVMAQYSTGMRANQIGDNESKEVEEYFHLMPSMLYIIHNGKELQICQGRVNGTLKMVTKEHVLEFKSLVKHGQEMPTAVFALAEVRTGGLMGYSQSNNNNNQTILNIPLVDRLKNRIYKEKI